MVPPTARHPLRRVRALLVLLRDLRDLKGCWLCEEPRLVLTVHLALQGAKTLGCLWKWE